MKMEMKISINPVRRHLLVATTRICALLVLLISSPLLYFSTPVVASSLVTISFTVAFIGSCNKHTIRPSLPFDPSPPLVMHIINLTTFPSKYSTRCITFIARPPRPRPQNKPPDPILFALTLCIIQVSRMAASLLLLTLKLMPPHPILHYLARYTTLHCLHPTADVHALTLALHTGISFSFHILCILRHRLATFEHTLRRVRGLLLSLLTSLLTWFTHAPPLVAHGLILAASSRQRNANLILLLLPLLCLPLVAAAPHMAGPPRPGLYVHHFLSL